MTKPKRTPRKYQDRPSSHTVKCPREDGDSWESGQTGVGIIGAMFGGGSSGQSAVFCILLWPSCAKSGILLVHGGQRETGIPGPHELGQTRERLKEVRATRARAKKSGPLTPPCPNNLCWRCGVLPKQEAREAASAPVSRPGAWPRSNGADPKTKPVKSPVAGGPRQDTVPFLSCVEEQKLRFQGQEHSAALRVPVRLGGRSWLVLFRPASEPRLPRALQSSSCPRNTWKCLQAQRNASEVPERAVVLGGDRFRGGWGFL